MTKRTITIDESRETAGVKVTAEPLTAELDELELAKGPAEAMRVAIAKGIGAIGASAKASSVARRRRAGIPGSKLFNATGKLRAGVEATPAGTDGYQISAPTDRLEDDAMARRLVELVPVLQDPTKDPAVAAALAKADAMTAQVGKGGRR